MKVVKLHEWTPKQFLRPTLNTNTAPKSLNNPKIKSKSNVRIEGNIENESCPTTRIDHNPNPKNSPLGPQKVKTDPKIKSKSNVRIERNKENESCSTT